MTSNSFAQMPHISVTKAFFTSVEAQTDMSWLNRADKPTRLTVKTAEQNITASNKATKSSQAAITAYAFDHRGMKCPFQLLLTEFVFFYVKLSF
jgi:hypothetical protein